MLSTYLSSRAIIDRLLANSQFVSLAQSLVKQARGSTQWSTDYVAISALLISLGVITPRVVITESDGAFYFDSTLTQEQTKAVENHNSRPEFLAAVNYAWGNPICNKDLYPKSLRSTVCAGYGLAERFSSTIQKDEQVVAFTYKGEKSPLSNDVFSLRVGQSA